MSPDRAAGPVVRATARPAVRLAVRVVASLVVLAVVAWVVGGQAIRDGTAVLTPVPVAVALLLGLLWRALTATRWLLLARALGAPLGWGEAYAEYLRSELLNQVVPGGVLGDVDRARRHGEDVGLLPAARAVALERAVGQVVLVVAVVVAVLLHPELLRVADGADRRTGAVVLGVLAVLSVVAVLLWQPWRQRGPVPGSTRPGAGAGGPALLPALAAALGLSVGVLACFVALFVLAARTTAPATGPTPGLGDLVPAVLVVLLVSGVPLTLAGWGAREAGAALCFAAVGLAAADGVAASVGYGLLSLLSALPGLLPLLLPHHGGPHAREVEVEADVVTEPERP